MLFYFGTVVEFLEEIKFARNGLSDKFSYNLVHGNFLYEVVITWRELKKHYSKTMKNV